jgi:hypothetical protein
VCPLFITGLEWNKPGTRIAGGVNVLYGSPTTGLTNTGDQIFHQNVSGVHEVSESVNWFGGALTSTDFNGDGYDDLIAGAYQKTVNSVAGAGAVYLLKGSSAGLTTSGSMEWTPESDGINSPSEVDGFFGFYLSVGRFNNWGNGRDSLVISYNRKTINGLSYAGEIYVLWGQEDVCFRSDRIRVINRGSNEIPGYIA